MIIRSKLPSAEKFERWVFDEVLPELRKNGSYGNNFNLEEVIAKTATAVVSEVLKQIINRYKRMHFIVDDNFDSQLTMF